MQTIAILLSGFSVFYVLVFILTHFKNDYYHDQKIARMFGIMLMLCLAGLQVYHFNYLTNVTLSVITNNYLLMLYLVAPSFYFYARSALKAEDKFKAYHLLHFVPLVLISILKNSESFTFAFIIGTSYLFWLLKAIYALKTHKQQFKNELILLVMAFIIAFGVSIAALIMPFELKLFYSLYAIAIGIALFIVALVVGYEPTISETITEAAKETYATTTLGTIDCEEKLLELNSIMQDDKLYQQNNIDSHTIATELDLSTHQLSELINTKLKMGFSQYLRLQRVNAAKYLLLSKPNSSVLSIGLDVGFSSQSNFYQAFKEITQTTPAKFRKQKLLDY